MFLDDATRYVLKAFFAPTLDQSIVESCFRQAIQEHGLPEAVYFDYGSQYRTKWMNRTLGAFIGGIFQGFEENKQEIGYGSSVNRLRMSRDEVDVYVENMYQAMKSTIE